MISKKDVSSAIEKAGERFELSWQILSRPFKEIVETKSGRQLIDVQLHLIDAFWILDSQYRKLIQAKTRLIENKHKYNEFWFKRRMAQLDRYLKGVKNAIGIGKALGDGYAWIFYRNEIGLIEKHLERQRQTNLPPGIGAIGERAFVEKLQGFNRHFVLYHGITSFLRMGDVSFIDLKKAKVTSIGELKTKQIGKDEYQITLGCSYGEAFKLPTSAGIVSKREGLEHKLPAPMERRLSRQMNQIMQAFDATKANNSPIKVNTKGHMYFDELGQVIGKSKVAVVSCQKAGKSLLITVVRDPTKNLSRRLLGSNLKNLEDKMGAVANEARAIADKTLHDNCLFMSSVGYYSDGFPLFILGGVPLFWWPINKQHLYDLIFHKVIVITLHNPAHFWEMLRQRGYAVTVDDRSRFVRAVKSEGKLKMELHNMDYLGRLTKQFLISDECVLEMLDQLLLRSQKEGIGAPARINIVPIIHIGSEGQPFHRTTHLRSEG